MKDEGMTNRLGDRCEMCWAVLFGRSIDGNIRAYRYCPYCGIMLDLPDGA